mmetsp:Transcript_20615/g.33466  ORF Transcript_20615/g.33466 Transcript_20615/m.33466 type:complete len:206 (-) Transcript_20615:1565-2182(-)
MPTNPFISISRIPRCKLTREENSTICPISLPHLKHYALFAAFPSSFPPIRSTNCLSKGSGSSAGCLTCWISICRTNSPAATSSSMSTKPTSNPRGAMPLPSSSVSTSASRHGCSRSATTSRSLCISSAAAAARTSAIGLSARTTRLVGKSCLSRWALSGGGCGNCNTSIAAAAGAGSSTTCIRSLLGNRTRAIIRPSSITRAWPL